MKFEWSGEEKGYDFHEHDVSFEGTEEEESLEEERANDGHCLKGHASVRCHHNTCMHSMVVSCGDELW